jgi:hypothetical protein
MYTSDLAKLLQTLRGTQKNYVVHIELPKAAAIGPGEPWQAQLTLIEGKVTCKVWSRVDKRVLFTNDEAIRWLATLPHLSWSLEPFVPQRTPVPALRRSQAISLQLIPRRIAPVDKKMMNTWSRKQRQVFALVNGTRTIEHIATILQQPPHVVEQVLDDLQAIGVVQRERD